MTKDLHPRLTGARCGRVRLAVGHISSLVAATVELIVPLAIALGVGVLGSEERASQQVWMLVVTVVIVSGAAAAWRAVALARIGAEEMRRLRLGVARELLRLPPRSVEQYGVGESVAVYSRTVNELEPLLSAAHIRRRTAVVMLAGCLVLLFWFDWRLASALFGGLSLAAVLIAVVLRPVKVRAGRALTALGRTAADLDEHLASARSATVWGLAESHLRRLEVELRDVAGAEQQIGRAQAVVDLVVKTTSMVLLIGLGGFGVLLVSQDALSAARLSGFIATLAVLFGPAALCAQAAQEVQRARAALDQLGTLPAARVPRPPSIENQAPSAPPAIRVSRAQCSPAERVVSAPVSFAAGPGEMVCLTGPSGSGKTTMLSALASLAPVVDGTITVGGIDVGAYDQASLWRQIGYVEQTTPVLGASVRAFLTPDPAQPPDLEVVMRLVEDLGLRDRLGREPLDASLQRSGASLSGGERQRLAIIRALASDRPVLLLDEPTAHLDSESEERVLDAIDRHRAGRVVIVASHAAAFIRRADRVVQLSPD